MRIYTGTVVLTRTVMTIIARLTTVTSPFTSTSALKSVSYILTPSTMNAWNWCAVINCLKSIKSEEQNKTKNKKSEYHGMFRL